jgi:hypothetical protein
MCSNDKYEEICEPQIDKFDGTHTETETEREREREREDETQLSIDSGIYIVTNLPALYSLHQVCQVHVLQHPYTEELHLKGM